MSFSRQPRSHYIEFMTQQTGRINLRSSSTPTRRDPTFESSVPGSAVPFSQSAMHPPPPPPPPGPVSDVAKASQPILYTSEIFSGNRDMTCWSA